MMMPNRNSMSQAVLTPLGSTWEDTVAAGLRQATDVELLWMLDEIEVQLGERAPAWAGPRPAADGFGMADDIPDWDDKTPQELEAIVRELETEPDEAAKPFRPRGPSSRRAERLLSSLRCEELEPRLPPSTFITLRIEVEWAPAITSVRHEEAVYLAGSGSRFHVQMEDASYRPATWGEEDADRLACALVA